MKNRKRFKKFYIEITNVCNLNCDFCPKTQRSSQYMTIEDFKYILSQIKPYTEYIYFHVKGEPLLHPELETFLDISHEYGYKVNITTNGTLLPKVKDKLYNKPALRQINISLHSMEGNKENKFEKEYNDHIEVFVKEAREKSDIIISLRQWDLDEETDDARGIKLEEKVYLNQDYRFKWPGLDEEEDDGIGFCYGLRNQIAILVDGTVVPCCLDGEGVINLGNIKETPFTQIIESPRAKSIIEGFSNNRVVEELCRKCGYRKRFK